jgi:hypothetical protein
MNKEDRKLFLMKQADQLYRESKEINNIYIYKPKFKLSTFIDNNMRAVIMCSGPTAFVLLSIITSIMEGAS